MKEADQRDLARFRAAQSEAVAWPSVEAVARKICLSYGSDPDELASILEICTADNKPLPRWRLYEEQAEAVAELYATPPASPARDEVIELLASKFPITFTTFGNGKTPNALAANVADVVLAALSRSSTVTAPVIGGTAWCGHGVMASICPQCAALSSQGATREARPEEIAMALCLVDGRDPDAEAPLSEMCTDDNQSVPLWMVYVEYAEAILEKFSVHPRSRSSTGTDGAQG